MVWQWVRQVATVWLLKESTTSVRIRWVSLYHLLLIVLKLMSYIIIHCIISSWVNSGHYTVTLLSSIICNIYYLRLIASLPSSCSCIAACAMVHGSLMVSLAPHLCVVLEAHTRLEAAKYASLYSCWKLLSCFLKFMTKPKIFH